MNGGGNVADKESELESDAYLALTFDKGLINLAWVPCLSTTDGKPKSHVSSITEQIKMLSVTSALCNLTKRTVSAKHTLLNIHTSEEV